MKITNLILLLLLTCTVTAQDTIYFQQCLEASIGNAPRTGDKGLINDQLTLTNENIKSTWYPQVDMNGKASYQSDVVSLQIDQPGFMFDFPEMPHQQYGMNLDLKQMIYDGGLSRERMKYEQIAAELSLKEIDTDIQKIKDLVVRAYFNILLLDENRSSMQLALENFKAAENQLISAVRNGAAREADLKLVRVEILKVLQTISEIDAGRYGLIDLLQLYTNLDIEYESVFKTPFMELHDQDSIMRPEIQLFELKRAMLDASSKLNSIGRRPVLYAFGQAGAGMPGYNMLNNEFDTYYMVGAGLKWRILDWNRTKRNQEILEKRKQILNHGEETFEMQIEGALAKEFKKMEHLKNSISLDEQMLKMRIDLTNVAASELKNGTIQASEYIRILNEELLARISASKHHVELMQAIAGYNLIKGIL